MHCSFVFYKDACTDKPIFTPSRILLDIKIGKLLKVLCTSRIAVMWQDYDKSYVR